MNILKFLNGKHIDVNEHLLEFVLLTMFVILVLILLVSVEIFTGCVIITNMKNPINPIEIKVRIPPKIVLKVVAPSYAKSNFDPNMSIFLSILVIILNKIQLAAKEDSLRLKFNNIWQICISIKIGKSMTIKSLIN